MRILRKQLVLGMVMIVGGLILGGVSGCTGTGGTDSKEVAADVVKVKEVFEEYASAGAAGDLERWMSLWSADSKRLAPNAPASMGAQEIRVAVGPVFELFDFEEFIVNPEEVRIFGDHAYSLGTYSFLMAPKAGGDTIEDSGKFLTILEKQADGSWKIAVDSFNTSLPLPAS